MINGSGILLGLAAAGCQSASYLFSRVFAAKYRGGTVALLALSHVLMGAFSIILLLFALPRSLPPFVEYAPALFCCAFSYLAGQAALFMALKRTDASRVSPFLGLKVLMLACVSACLLGKSYSALQWSAVGLSVLAAGLLNWSGGSMAWQSILWALAACVGYFVSDLSIPIVESHFDYLGTVHGTVLTTCLCYVVCGVLALPAFLLLPRLKARMWLDSLPFAVAWFAAMLLLFGCFVSIGVVFGNIVQASRGLISILLGASVAAMGWVHLEGRVTAGVLVRRAVAALLMFAAIALFYAGGRP